MKVFLGIDTSSYTSSMCLLGEDGIVLADERKVLDVASGSRGLRQSEALFQHVQNIPALTSKLAPYLKDHSLQAIAVSTKPRPQEGSYMPVFLPGSSFAQALSHMLGIPCHELSHQESHIWSGIGSSGGPTSEQFLTIHLSGGTTEMALVRRGPKTYQLAIDLMGGTLDLHAGQVVDRIGVKLGLPFPSGPALEKLAKNAPDTVSVPTFHRTGMVSFSGPLSALERLVGAVPAEEIACACLKAIARTLVKWIRWAEGETNCRELLVVGGVAANQVIRTTLGHDLPNWTFHYASPVHSVDNAYGAAYFCALVAGGGS